MEAWGGEGDVCSEQLGELSCQPRRKGQDRAGQQGPQCPDGDHRLRTTLGALVPKGRPKEIPSFNYTPRLPGQLARVPSARLPPGLARQGRSLPLP